MNYSDAFPPANQAVNVSQLVHTLIDHFFKQLKYVFHGLTRPRWNNRLIDMVTGYSMIVYTTITVIGAWHVRRTKLFATGCALLMFSLLGVCLTLYSGILYILVKTTFYCAGMLIIPAVAFTLNPSIREKSRFVRHVYQKRQFALVAIAALSVFSLGVTAYQAQLAKHIQEDCARFVESTNPVPNMLISTTPYLFALYNIKHYPQLTSFIPANKKTLALLNTKYPIGTMIIPKEDIHNKLTTQDIQQIGLTFINQRQFKGQDYLVFKRVN